MSFTVFDIETTGSLPWRDELVAVGIGDTVYRPEQGRKMARMMLARPSTTVVCHTNYDLRWLLLDGAKMADGVSFHDTKVMAWLLDGTQELDLRSLVIRYLDKTPPKPIRMVGGRVMFEARRGLVPIEDVPWGEMSRYNASDLKCEAALYVRLKSLLQEEGLWTMFLQEEAPFSRLLIEMESAGMPFDREAASSLLGETLDKANEIRDALVESTGAIDFNPGSGDQVARFLYTELWTQPVKFDIPRLNGMSPEEKMEKVKAIAPPGVRVTKVGRDYAYGTQSLEGRGLRVPKEKHPGSRPTVNQKVLNVLYGDDPWVSWYVEWRRLDKLRSYLVDWLRREHNGRLHGRFDQSGTITGRLSAREPNLQQVAKGSDVRGLFRGDLIVGDYAGLEARLGAHFSGDQTMLDIFWAGKDLYGVLAARAWGGPESKENPKRDLMKVVWLASQYGAKGETLAQTMAVNGLRGYTPRQADDMRNDMQESVPRLFEWRDEVIEKARRDGYVTTLAGRRRRLVDIYSAQWQKVYKAERQAVNSLVQGSAADVVRRAMLAARLKVQPREARICLQVHDEIVWEKEPEWQDDVFVDLVRICENDFGFDLSVPLVFEAVEADSWAIQEGIQLEVAS